MGKFRKNAGGATTQPGNGYSGARSKITARVYYLPEQATFNSDPYSRYGWQPEFGVMYKQPKTPAFYQTDADGGLLHIDEKGAIDFEYNIQAANQNAEPLTSTPRTVNNDQPVYATVQKDTSQTATWTFEDDGLSDNLTKDSAGNLNSELPDGHHAARVVSADFPVAIVNNGESSTSEQITTVSGAYLGHNWNSLPRGATQCTKGEQLEETKEYQAVHRNETDTSNPLPLLETTPLFPSHNSKAFHSQWPHVAMTTDKQHHEISLATMHNHQKHHLNSNSSNNVIHEQRNNPHTCDSNHSNWITTSAFQNTQDNVAMATPIYHDHHRKPTQGYQIEGIVQPIINKY